MPKFFDSTASGTEGKKTEREHPTSSDVACSRKTLWVELSERYSNKRRRVARLSSAWNEGTLVASPDPSEPSDPHLARATEPRRRPRTQLTDSEVTAMRTLREKGISVNALARQFGVHRTTVWLKTR